MLNLKRKLPFNINRFVPLLLLLLLVALTAVGLFQVRTATELRAYVGEYYLGDGFFACRLILKENQSFSLEWFQDNANTKEYYGTFTLENKYIELHAEEFLLDHIGCFSERLVLVKWDTRRYLFFDDGDERSKYVREQFCRNVFENRELDREKLGSFFPYIHAADKDRINEFENIPGSRPMLLDGSPFCPK